ncbi:MAG TPA: DNA-3-methyladenine glycosylase [Bacteroidales bacterium]|nr:DNA-3-methyladenine glycosylase [Bacteroidales bacterium]
MKRVGKEFFKGDVLHVAERLPGMDIVMKHGEDQVRYTITETEAYNGMGDKACHASKGRTPRTEVMFREGGVLYIYFVYGMHWMMNIVTGEEGNPQAVLIRGVGEVTGPGRVTKAMGIDRSFNGESLITSPRIWIEDPGRIVSIRTGPRVGINYAGEPWISMPWRFLINS